MLSEPTTAAEVLERARLAQAWKRSLGRKPVFSPASDPPAKPTTQHEPRRLEIVPYLGIMAYPVQAASSVSQEVLTPRSMVFLRQIIERVAEYYGIRVSEMLSDRKSRSVTFPRQVAMFLCREATPQSLPCISRAFNRDWTTVIHAIQKIDALRQKEPAVRDELNAILAGLEAAHGCVLHRY